MGKPTLRNGHCAGFWSLHPHHIYKLTQSFRNWVCPILKWNGQRPPTNSSDCWTQFSSCVPTLLHDDGNWSSSNRCLLLSTQNNKVQTLECPRVTYYIQKALELVQYFSNLIRQKIIWQDKRNRTLIPTCKFLHVCLSSYLYRLHIGSMYRIHKNVWDKYDLYLLIYDVKWYCGITSCTQRDTWNFPLRNIGCPAVFGSRRNQRIFIDMHYCLCM
jgi:hypothetical protein